MTEKNMLFLGAGASVSAGLPTANNLTKMFREYVQSHNRENWANFLSIIINAWDSLAKSQTESPVNVGYEDWLATMNALCNPEEEPLLPLIDSWDTTFKKFLDAAHIEPGIFRTLGDRIIPYSNGELCLLINCLYFTTEFLKEHLWIEQKVTTNAIAPLLKLVPTQEPLTITTLNYDNVIEKLAECHKLSYDTAYPYWLDKGTFEFRQDVRVNLMKLHGSLDWKEPQEYPSIDDETWRSCGIEPDNNHSPNTIHIVAGAHDKHRFDGPFPAVFQAFRSVLWSKTKLVVVGYSFRDVHINHTLLSWLTTDNRRMMIVVDPEPDAAIQNFSDLYRPAFGGAPYKKKSPNTVKQIIPIKIGIEEKTWEKVASIW